MLKKYWGTFCRLLFGQIFIILSLSTSMAQEYTCHNNNIQQVFSQIQKDAWVLAGNPEDIEQRVEELKKIYEHSNGNHQFPAIALHGALWMKSFFHKTEQALKYAVLPEDFLELNYFNLKAKLNYFMDKIQTINRRVFVDTYTYYYFSWSCYGLPINRFIRDTRFLKTLNKIHAANIHGSKLSQKEKTTLYRQSLIYEQNTMVSSRMDKLYLELPKYLKYFMRPSIRFKYFPFYYRFPLVNYFKKKDRIKYAIKAHEIGIEVGFQEVLDSVIYYNY